MKKLLLSLLLPFAATCAFAQKPQLQVAKVAPRVWVHTSYSTLNGVTVPSNGLIIATSEGLVLLDTAWGEEQTEQLLRWIKENLKQRIKMCIITHAHDDRLGGVAALQRENVVVFSSAQTASIAAERQLGQLIPTLPVGHTVTVGQQQLVIYYPGAGHAPDNLVLYLPRQRVLYGGCLVKGAAAKSLGNVADADLENWPNAIHNVQQRFPRAKLVVPGHGPWSGKAALAHTLALLQQP